MFERVLTQKKEDIPIQAVGTLTGHRHSDQVAQDTIHANPRQGEKYKLSEKARMTFAPYSLGVLDCCALISIDQLAHLLTNVHSVTLYTCVTKLFTHLVCRFRSGRLAVWRARRQIKLWTKYQKPARCLVCLIFFRAETRFTTGYFKLFTH